ncbi:MAG: tRNA preQ1(34) S-adenosylmethionine ribosyltransferase-isomerase QueA [Nitrospirae bacterium]|nr:tRNA preQ1(34) S-adenosylmethionine ribosyltransferase-isomerase QueA [Nitrospirota bacterium]
MKLSDFDYPLPKEQIAQYPLRERDSSRLLVFNRKEKRIEHRVFRDLSDYLKSGDVLILNNTKVMPARIFGRKPTGGKVEILLIKELNHYTWEAMVKGIEEGAIVFDRGISAHVSRNHGVSNIKFNDDIREHMHTLGVMPLPPYIKRKADTSDAEQYQTVYAANEGAIAAPTAGLHFTEGLIDEIKSKGVHVEMLTLHVGCGTFKPVKAHDIREHKMDEEVYEISEPAVDTINNAKAEGRRIIAVGTTVTRTLEAEACKIQGQGARDKGQGKAAIKAGRGDASIFIYPGYKFKIVDVLITNFHLPKSTPLMLTSAFTGLDELKNIYDEAISLGYRFFSYGDAMLVV